MNPANGSNSPTIKHRASTLNIILDPFSKPARQAMNSPKRSDSPRSKAEEKKILDQTSRIMNESLEIMTAKAIQREINSHYLRLSSISEERKKELAERLGEIQDLVMGKPSKDSGRIVSLSIAISEMWRTAASTDIEDCGEKVQAIKEDSHIRLAKVNDEDIAKRFLKLYDIYRKYSDPKQTTPDTKGWNYEVCLDWAKKNEPALTNEKMQRFLRSSSQALYSGTLSHYEMIKHALPDPESNKLLQATVPACGQMIYRIFNKDQTSEIKLVLPYELKKRTNLEVVATLVVDYHIIFDKEMNAISLVSKVMKPVLP